MNNEIIRIGDNNFSKGYFVKYDTIWKHLERPKKLKREKNG